MKIKQNLVGVVAGMLLAYGASYGAELDYLTHEANLTTNKDGAKEVEWTILKTQYKLSDNLKLKLDIDKDYVETASGSEQEGWDTQVKLTQSFGKINDWRPSVNYVFEYDSKWLAEDSNKRYDQTEYIIAPYFEKRFKSGSKLFAFGVELSAQAGKKSTDDYKERSRGELNLSLKGKLSKNWKLYSMLGNHKVYDTDKEKYNYQLQTVNSLTYSKKMNKTVTLYVENYVDSLYDAEKEKTEVEAYIKPGVKFKKRVNNRLSITGGVSYELLSYDYQKEQEKDAVKNWDQNEFNAKLGFKIQ